ncbi:AAA domain-containing protein, putative AbiEii toxin, Type IV TA system [Paraburkholderia phenazinium]|uniref:AAA domain-containing protein, putative AbiEii toxin, Type IV TA system n=1 Tax=Paraburkholderia phenazinium TaxID=60549 RepID=A0A1G8I023_9BURK|nr:AAA domain-containing protein, putative AbiEii toxin, Type IV TA system [Paraburkholderia phenazinium]SDI59463.1 AAA domain-containing protein, putative AbiEii toxin, Type IV TA system [Paraburkholderia phenazinium]
MISSIHLDSCTLELLTPSNRRKGKFRGFFGVDSFSLLIGCNGAGKTRVLRQIAWAFHDTEQIVKVGVRYSDSEAYRKKNHRQEYGVVYYTPIPYRVNLPKSTRNFYDATPSYGKLEGGLDVDFQYYELVRRELGFKLRPMVVLGFDRAMILTAIARVILSNLSTSEKTKGVLYASAGQQRLRSMFPEFLKSAPTVLRHFTNAFASHLVAERNNAEPFEDVPGQIQEIGTAFMLEIQRLIDLNLAGHVIPVLSALEQVINTSRKKTVPVEAFLQRYFLDGEPLSNVRDGGLAKKLETLAMQKVNLLLNEDRWRNYRVGDRVGKSVYVDDDATLKRYRLNVTHSRLAELVWENFSSGQLALLYQFSAIRRGIDELKDRGLSKFLVLLDEGDIYLHAAWQREYVRLLDLTMSSMKRAAEVKSLQLILSSHSTSLLTDVPRDCVTRLSTKDEPAESHNVEVRSFAASLEDIVNSSFETGSLGAFAHGKIKESIGRLEEGEANEIDDHLLSIIDDPILLREMKKLRERRRVYKRGVEE